MLGRDHSDKGRLAIVESMAATPSPEVEAVIRRVLMAWQAADAATISNLFSDDSTLRVLGTDPDEWWVGPNEFLGVFEAQSHDMPDWTMEIQKTEAFEDGPLAGQQCSRL